MNIVFSSVLESEITLVAAAVIFFTSILTGFILSRVYIHVNKYGIYNDCAVWSIFVMPLTISAVTMVCWAASYTSIIFAVVLGAAVFKMWDMAPKDGIYFLSAAAVGISCGAGYVACATYYVIIFSICMIAMEKMKYGKNKDEIFVLNVEIPETEEYINMFDDIFDKYLSFWKMKNVKGGGPYSMYNVEYIIKLKNCSYEKNFIDSLKARNGELGVYISKLAI